MKDKKKREIINKNESEKGKKKLTYENIKVKGEDKVIKTQDGKYYIIKPVKLKS